MTITIEELEIAFSKTLGLLKRKGIKSFDPMKESYWYIPKESCYDPYKVPNSDDLTLGQLTDDILNLKDVAENKKQPMLYDLIWLSVVLRALGDQLEENNH